MASKKEQKDDEALIALMNKQVEEIKQIGNPAPKSNIRESNTMKEQHDKIQKQDPQSEVKANESKNGPQVNQVQDKTGKNKNFEMEDFDPLTNKQEQGLGKEQQKAAVKAPQGPETGAASAKDPKQTAAMEAKKATSDESLKDFLSGKPEKTAVTAPKKPETTAAPDAVLAEQRAVEEAGQRELKGREDAIAQVNEAERAEAEEKKRTGEAATAAAGQPKTKPAAPPPAAPPPANQNTTPQQNDQMAQLMQMIMALLQQLMKQSGAQAGAGQGSAPPSQAYSAPAAQAAQDDFTTLVNQAVAQPGAHQAAVGFLNTPEMQNLVQSVLQIPGVQKMVQSFLNDNSKVKTFAQNVLNDPALANLNQSLQKQGMIEGIGLQPKPAAESTMAGPLAGAQTSPQEAAASAREAEYNARTAAAEAQIAQQQKIQTAEQKANRASWKAAEAEYRATAPAREEQEARRQRQENQTKMAKENLESERQLEARVNAPKVPEKQEPITTSNSSSKQQASPPSHMGSLQDTPTAAASSGLATITPQQPTSSPSSNQPAHESENTGPPTPASITPNPSS